MPPEVNQKILHELLPWIVDPPTSSELFVESMQLGIHLSAPIHADNFYTYIVESADKLTSPTYTSYWIQYSPKNSLEVLGLIGKSGTAKSTPEISVIPRKEILSDKFKRLPNITLELTENSLSVFIHKNHNSLSVDLYELEVGKDHKSPLSERPLSEKDGALYANLGINSGKYLILTTGNMPFAAIAYKRETISDGESPVTSAIMILSSRLFWEQKSERVAPSVTTPMPSAN